MNRRGFLKSLAAVPVAASVAPAVLSDASVASGPVGPSQAVGEAIERAFRRMDVVTGAPLTVGTVLVNESTGETMQVTSTSEQYGVSGFEVARVDDVADAVLRKITKRRQYSRNG